MGSTLGHLSETRQLLNPRQIEIGRGSLFLVLLLRHLQYVLKGSHERDDHSSGLEFTKKYSKYIRNNFCVSRLL